MKIRFSRLAIAAALALAAAISARAGLTFTVTAPNGVGDVVALTNAIDQINKLNGMNPKNGSQVWLEPGVYDLAGIAMKADSHLYMDWHNCWLSGKGDAPGDVVLVGGGETEQLRVLACYGSNYGWCNISNLTVTGGYSLGDGGGICGSFSTRYFDLIVTNNYAVGSNGGGGGGVCHGQAHNCLFADNSTAKNGGGLWIYGGGKLDTKFFEGAWDCVFSNNVANASGYGGGLYGLGKCFGCTFVGNRAGYGGGFYAATGISTWFDNKGTNWTEVADCTFTGNTMTQWGHGSAIYNGGKAALIPVSNCVFTANVDTSFGGYGVVSGCNVNDSAIVANQRNEYIVYNCNLNRCLVANNTNTAANISIDYTNAGYTNVNCLFKGNVVSGTNTRVIHNKTLVNCDIIDNKATGANYGAITPGCKLWNCVLIGNTVSGTPKDLRANMLNQTAVLTATNCLFTAADVAEDYMGLGNCHKVARAKFKFVDDANGDYTPLTGSPCTDKGLQSDWILRLVGDLDLAGNRRIFVDGLDIGAFECQDYPPALKILVR